MFNYMLWMRQTAEECIHRQKIEEEMREKLRGLKNAGKLKKQKKKKQEEERKEKERIKKENE